MCAVCGLPTTHVNTFSTVSMVSLFLMVFWTFVWAWWIVTKVKVGNYFINSLQSVVSAKRVGYMRTVRQLLARNKKFQIGTFLFLMRVALLVWAYFDSQKVVNLVEPTYTDQYIAVPIIDTDGKEILQLKKL